MKTRRLKKESTRKIASRPRKTRNLLSPEAFDPFLTAIVKSSNDAVIGKNLRGIILSWNPGAEKIYGYQAREAFGRPISFLLPPGRANEIPAILKKIKRVKKIGHYQSKRQARDDRRIEVESSLGKGTTFRVYLPALVKSRAKI